MNSKKHTLITGLLYPALMGAWMYEALDIAFNSWKNSTAIDIVQFALVVSILIHYIVDYIFTLEDGPKIYSWWHFLLDIVFISCLYIGLKLSLAPDYQSTMLIIWSTMVVFKFFAVVWDWIEKDFISVGIDAFFFIVYLIGACIIPQSIWSFIVICLIDSLFYKFDADIKTKYV